MSNTKSGGLFSFLLKDRIVAPKNFNRWRIPPASIAIHLCIGSVYAWSIFNPALINSNVMYKVISFDIDAGSNGKSEFLDRRTVPEVWSNTYAALAVVSKE